MDHLLLALLELLVKLVLYAVTGKWHDLGELKRQLLEPQDTRPRRVPPVRRTRVPRTVEQARAERKARVSSRGASAKERATSGGKADPGSGLRASEAAAARRGAGSDAQAWPFVFEGDRYEPESEDEEQGGELPVKHHATFQRRAVNKLASAAPKPGPRSLARALRDPRTVREAIALGAALGRRGPRH
jgi:hypothetical protein